MTAETRERRGAALALALMRVTLVAVIFVTQRLVDRRGLDGPEFWVLLGLFVAYSLFGLIVAIRFPSSRALVRVQPGFDVFLLSVLVYSSGGAFSDVCKAFFVIPLAAAFNERPRSTAVWSLIAVVSFTVAAVMAAGHVAGSLNTWQRVTVSDDLYLAWTGAVATVLALALKRRSAHTTALSESRRRLVTHAIEAVERERTRLAGALHDEPVQNLIAARHDLRRAERTGDRDSFARLHDVLTVTIAELREEVFNLHPYILDHVGLGAAIEQLAQQHARDGDLRITVDIDPEATVAYERLLFSLARELIANAAAHARANEVRVRLTRWPECVNLVVSDDGRGIADGRVQQALLEGHIGLTEISERVAALDGHVAITTAPGRGTRVDVTLPTSTAEGGAARAESGTDEVSRQSDISDRGLVPH